MSALLVVEGGTVVTPGGVIDDGRVVIEGDRISAVERRTPANDRRDVVVDAAGGWIVPGFIDVQINGAHGIDVTTQPERLDELARVLPRYGVTSFLPTIVTCSPDRRAAALATPAATSGPGRAVARGWHVEGPMLSPVRKGAHPEQWLTPPSAELVDGWSAANGVALVTLAPELHGALDVIRRLVHHGVAVSIGHTDCSADQFTAAVGAGATYVTHLFNAMRPFSHRDPGPIGAALADDGVVVGLIADGLHVDPVAVRMAWRALGPHRLNLVTDAISALGLMPDDTGAVTLGSVAVTAGVNGVRTADGVLAGSTLSLDAAVRNVVRFTGSSPIDAVATVTSTPARLLGLDDCGRLVPGARGDVTVLDRQLHVIATVVGGEVAWRS